MKDNINSPTHYKRGGLETIDIIEAFGLNFNLGNVTKYTFRAGYKNDRLEDLRKALWYLQREIDYEASFCKEIKEKTKERKLKCKKPRWKIHPKKLTVEEVLQIRETIASKSCSLGTIAQNFKVDISTIQDIKQGRTWRGI